MANYRCRSAHSGPEPQCFTLQIKVAGPGKANLGPGNRKTRPSWPEKADSGPGNHAEAGRAAARPKNKAHLRTDCLFSFRPSTAHRRDLPGGRKIGRISPKWSQNPAGGRKIGGIPPGPERVAAVDDRTALAAALIPVIFPRKNPGEPIYLLRFQVFLLLFYYLCGSA